MAPARNGAAGTARVPPLSRFPPLCQLPSLRDHRLLLKLVVDDPELAIDVEHVLQVDIDAVRAAGSDVEVAGPEAEQPVPKHVRTPLLDAGPDDVRHLYTVA